RSPLKLTRPWARQQGLLSVRGQRPAAVERRGGLVGRARQPAAGLDQAGEQIARGGALDVAVGLVEEERVGGVEQQLTLMEMEYRGPRVEQLAQLRVRAAASGERIGVVIRHPSRCSGDFRCLA